MSWIRRHPIAAIAALALILRAVSAVVTEFKPIFPAYYYNDANNIRAAALSAFDDANSGRRPTINGTLAERIQTRITLDVYRIFGPRNLPVKLLNALLGALAVAVLTWSLSLVFPAEAAWAAGLLVAVWPSHVFYTSQNLKEAPADLLAYAALGAALAASSSVAPRSRSAVFALGACLALLGAGFYRSYVLICLSAGLLLMLVLKARARTSRANAFAAAAAVIAALAFYPSASRALLLSFQSSSLGATGLGRIQSPLIPITHDEFDPGVVYRPTSPRGITGFRRSRQLSDRNFAMRTSRKIGTQIYPDAEFNSWGGLIAYLPKGAFAVLFMPLPGLYPLDEKIGRYAAAGENGILLVLAAFAFVGFVRGPKTPARLGLLTFFFVMTAGAALLEFDLGSAGRHKLLYLPMLFPFAAEEIFRLFDRKEPT